MVEKVRGTDLPLIAVRMEVGIEFRSRDEDRASTNTEQQGIKWNGWSKAQVEKPRAQQQHMTIQA